MSRSHKELNYGDLSLLAISVRLLATPISGRGDFLKNCFEKSWKFPGSMAVVVAEIFTKNLRGR